MIECAVRDSPLLLHTNNWKLIFSPGKSQTTSKGGCCLHIKKNIKKRWHEQTRRENELTGLDKSVEHLGCIGCMRLEPGMDDMVVVCSSTW